MTRDDGDSKHRSGKGAKRTMFVIHGTNVILCSIHVTEKKTSHLVNYSGWGTCGVWDGFEKCGMCFAIDIDGRFEKGTTIQSREVLSKNKM